MRSGWQTRDQDPAKPSCRDRTKVPSRTHLQILHKVPRENKDLHHDVYTRISLYRLVWEWTNINYDNTADKMPGAFLDETVTMPF